MAEYSVISLDYGAELACLLTKRLTAAGVKHGDGEEPFSIKAIVDKRTEKAFYRAAAEHTVIDLLPFELKRLTGLIPVSSRAKPELLLRAAEIAQGSGAVEKGRAYEDDVLCAEKKLKEHFKENSVLITEGLLRFGLPVVMEKWAMAVDRACEELFFENEYFELLTLMGMVNDIIEPELSRREVSLMLFPDETYTVADDIGRRIEGCRISPACIVSVIISLSPDRLTVYDMTGGNSKKLIRTIGRVFGNRAKIYVST